MLTTEITSRIITACLYGAVAAYACVAAANPFETVLPNGLHVIVKEDRRAPTVVHMMWYQAGSMDEFNGTTGVAHVLEHMMFKGTKAIGMGEFSKRVAQAGGRDNAFTSRDYTAYFQQVHKAQLPAMMALESDRMQNLLLSEAEFNKEIKVVMEERRWRTDDKPKALVYEAMVASAFKTHPYRVPVIGWMNDLQNMTYRDAQDWYARWYAPNNATLIIVGDVDHDEVFRLATQHYGGAKAKPLPVRKPQDEPQQTGIRRLSVKASAELPYLLMAFRVPKLVNIETDWEPYALEVLAAILDGNPSARFNQSLVREKRIAQSVGAGYDNTARGPEQFMLDGVPAEGRTVPELENALRAEVAKVAKEGVTEAELNRIKAQTVSAQVFKRDSIFGQAMEIAQLEMVNISHRNIDRIIEKLRGVTAQQVQQVAQKYFGDDQLTVAVLDPQPLDPDKKPLAPPAGLKH